MVKLVYKLTNGKYCTDDGDTACLQEAEDFSDRTYPEQFTPHEEGKLIWAEAPNWKESHDYTM